MTFAFRGGRGAASASRPDRGIRQAHTGGVNLGTSYLGVGTGVVATLQVFYGLTLFAANWERYPNPLPVLLAWGLLLLSLAIVAVTITMRGESMPNWLFLTAVGLVLIAAALDVAALWSLGSITGLATAAVCASSGLVVAVTLRRQWEILAASALLGALLIVGIALGEPITTSSLPGQIGLVALAVLPPIFGAYVVARFRRLVQTELDRVLVQSTISAPSFTVGMLASGELARLDLAAEELLDAVATGRTPLPLDADTASRAASLATELRLHLLQGRQETWLHHAITESETLGQSVSLLDRSGSAGMLDQRQRDGLLAAVWLLVSDRDHKPSTVTLEFGPSRGADEGSPGGSHIVPIVLRSTGIPRNRVNPASWDALAKVGRFTDSTLDSSLRVEIESVVDNPTA